MSTKTRTHTETREVKYLVCDICKKEITETNYAICEMCGRDIHSNTDCSVWDRDREEYACPVCYALGEHFRDVKERCRQMTDEAYEKWKSACEEHRHDDDD